MWYSSRAALLLFVSTCFASPSLAAPDGNITYAVDQGDTLYDLSQEFMIGPNAVHQVMQLNGIAKPQLLQIGQQIKLPRRLMKYRPVKLDLQTFSGPVSLQVNGRKVVPTIGYALAEGAIISTGPKGFAAIAGDDGSLLTIPSNSRIQIIDARRYLINDKIDVQIKVIEGRGEVQAPKLDGDARFRVGTPIAVTAVRGTQFRIAHSSTSNTSLTEVVEGRVSVSQNDKSVNTNAGFGVAAAEGRLGDNEELLPAPAILSPGTIQTKEAVEFAIESAPQTSRYRTQIARDAGFAEIVDEQVSDVPQAVFADLPDGRYSVRSRAISQNGLEGLSKAYSFRRKRLGVEAGMEPSPFADTFKFAWRTQGDGKSYSAFQLWDADSPSTLLIDELALDGSAILVGSLAPAVYKWRVATFQIDSDEVIKVWGPTQELIVSE